MTFTLTVHDYPSSVALPPWKMPDITDPRVRPYYDIVARPDGEVELTFAEPFDDLCLVSGSEISFETALRLSAAVAYFRSRAGLRTQ